MAHYLDERSNSGTSLPNIVPMIENLLFILFAVLVGTAGADEHVLEARLAQVKEANKSNRPSQVIKVTVTANKDSPYRLMGKPVDTEDVRNQLAEAKPGTPVSVAIDAGATWETIAVVLSAAHAAKLECKMLVEKEKQP